MKQPQGCIEKGKESLVCRLKRALDGFHQSGRACYFELNNVLNEIGLQKLNWCNCTNFYGNSIVLLVYVDDIVIFGQKERDIEDVLIKLKGNFNLKNMDFAANRDDRISMGGQFICLGNAPVTWRTFKEKSVSLSTMEAEFMRLVECIKGITWLDNIMNECASRDLVKYANKPVLLADNQTAIDFLKSPIENYRTKHIEWRSRVSVIGSRRDGGDFLNEGYKSKMLHFRFSLLLYTAVLRPIMSYGCSVWGYAAKTNINILDVAQNTVIRMIVGACNANEIRNALNAFK
ncbi:retrovirus-related Pol polyprotein from transposon TNT 1-94 [Trichonephila clavipes]|nr:retrovirus-related Pol polyprotein from transposon TNT 1-94 [Trichonephila clavipes]